jgi:hypothetical protein
LVSTSVLKVDPVLDFFPSVSWCFGAKVQLLLKKMKSSLDISWNKTEELKYKGETVQGSNVVDIVNDVLNKRKYFNPQGWENSEKPYEKQMFHNI